MNRQLSSLLSSSRPPHIYPTILRYSTLRSNDESISILLPPISPFCYVASWLGLWQQLDDGYRFRNHSSIHPHPAWHLLHHQSAYLDGEPANWGVFLHLVLHFCFLYLLYLMLFGRSCQILMSLFSFLFYIPRWSSSRGLFEQWRDLRGCRQNWLLNSGRGGKGLNDTEWWIYPPK